MKFSTREDIEAPIDFVFGRFTDFNAFERAALRRGADVQRLDRLTSPGAGMAWDASFDLRGRRREVQMEVTEYDPPNAMVLSSRSPTMGGSMVLEFVALSRGRTRVHLGLEMKPKNLSARLLVQSMKLIRGKLRKRFKHRVAGFAQEIENRYKRRA